MRSQVIRIEKSQKTGAREDYSPISSSSYASDDTLIGASCSDQSSTDPSSDGVGNGNSKKIRKSELQLGSVSKVGKETTGKLESLRAAPERADSAAALKDLEEQYENACEASVEDNSALSEGSAASSKASSKNVKRTKFIGKKVGGQSDKNAACSDTEEDKDYEYLRSRAGKFRELLKSKSKIPLAWSGDSEENFTELFKIEGDKNRMDQDIFVLIGFFVEFGRAAFNRVVLNRFRTNEGIKLKELVSKYNFFEREKKKITIQRTLALCPFYVAEHLYFKRGEVVGNVFALPRCYAFTGGIDLIPPNEEYQNLRDLWFLYESTFKKSFTEFWKKTEFLTINYTETSNGVKMLLFNTYNLTVPTEREILDSVAVEMKRQNIQRSGESFTLENFGKLCYRNISDSFAYYERLQKKHSSNIEGEEEKSKSFEIVT